MMSWQSFGFLDLAELGLHQRVDLAPDLATGGGEQTEDADVFRQMIADGARWHGHGAEAQQPADRLLHRWALLAERGIGAGAAAQHGDEQARGRLAQALDMTQQLVDPDRDLVAEGGGHRVLAMRAAGHRHVRRPFRQIGHGG